MDVFSVQKEGMLLFFI